MQKVVFCFSVNSLNLNQRLVFFSATNSIFFFLSATKPTSKSDAGENNWVTFIIENHTTKTLHLTDVRLHYGKWYKTACKACELRTVAQTIGPGSHALINAAGRLLSPTGAEAEFAIYDGNKDEAATTQILHLYFSIPFLVGQENIVNVRPFAAERYPVEGTRTDCN